VIIFQLLSLTTGSTYRIRSFEQAPPDRRSANDDNALYLKIVSLIDSFLPISNEQSGRLERKPLLSEKLCK